MRVAALLDKMIDGLNLSDMRSDSDAKGWDSCGIGSQIARRKRAPEESPEECKNALKSCLKFLKRN